MRLRTDKSTLIAINTRSFNRFFKATVVALLFPAFCAFGVVEGKPAVGNQVWVAISVLTQGLGHAASMFYGSIDEKVFANLTQSGTPAGFFELRNASWYSNKIFIHARDSVDAGGGGNLGYTGIFYFRIETVTEVILLDDAFVKKNFTEGTPRIKPHQ